MALQQHIHVCSLIASGGAEGNDSGDEVYPVKSFSTMPHFSRSLKQAASFTHDIRLLKRSVMRSYSLGVLGYSLLSL
jgi:hypothetical protein